MENEPFLTRRRRVQSETARQLRTKDTPETALSGFDHVVEQTAQKELYINEGVECRQTSGTWKTSILNVPTTPCEVIAHRKRNSPKSLQNQDSANTQCPLQRIMHEYEETDRMEGNNPKLYHVLRIQKRRSARVLSQVQDE